MINDRSTNNNEAAGNTGSLNDGSVPTALIRLQQRQFTLAAAVFVLSVVLSFVLKDGRMLLFILLSAYFIFAGLSSIALWRKGRVIGENVCCTMMKKHRFTDKTEVAFVVLENPNRAFHFILPGKNQARKFYVGGTYSIYYNIDTPNILLTSSQLYIDE